ncbi:MAG TPA: hypothetical protein VK395_09100, partial [Gemmataceae bacterium]|nr:hypothetical protein [Gemmataceae bacterium]
DLRRELFGMLLEEDARKTHEHRLKNDPAYVQGIKDAQASQKKAERQLAIQKMSGAERLAEAIERSISSGNLSSEMREQVKEMIAALKDPRNQAILGSVLATVGIAQFTPAGPVVDSIVGILGYILVGKSVLEAAPDLARFVTMALEAKDDSDFEQAGQYFARGISPLLIQAGTTLAGMGVAKAASAGAKLVGKRIAALKVSKKPITSEGGKLRVDPAIIADAEAEGATAATAKVGAGAPGNVERLLGHNEYAVSDAAKGAKTKQALLDYYKKYAKNPSIEPVEGMAGAQIDTVSGKIKIGREVLDKYPHLADGYLVEELRHFQVLQQQKMVGRVLTAAEAAALEKDIVDFMARPESGFKVFDPRKR